MERLDLCQQRSPVAGKGSYVSDIRARSCPDIVGLGQALGDLHLAVIAACVKLQTKRRGGSCLWRHASGRGAVSLAPNKVRLRFRSVEPRQFPASSHSQPNLAVVSGVVVIDADLVADIGEQRGLVYDHGIQAGIQFATSSRRRQLDFMAAAKSLRGVKTFHHAAPRSSELPGI